MSEVATNRRLRNGLLGAAIVGATAIACVAPAEAQQYKGEIFHPMLVTRTGPFATAASAVSSGQQDYFALVNAKGGVEGHKIVWEECEFEYKTPRALECYERYRGKWKIVYPNSTPAIFALADRVTADEVLAINLAGGRADSSDGKTFPYLAPVVDSFWSQASSTIRYIAQLEGGEHITLEIEITGHVGASEPEFAGRGDDPAQRVRRSQDERGLCVGWAERAAVVGSDGDRQIVP